MLGGAAVPRDRFGGILRHASALGIHAPEVVLRRGIALLGAGAEICEGLCGWPVFILCQNTAREGGDHEGDAHNVATHRVHSKVLADGHSTRRSCDGAIAGSGVSPSIRTLLLLAGHAAAGCLPHGIPAGTVMAGSRLVKILERAAGQQFAPFQGPLESAIAVGYVFQCSRRNHQGKENLLLFPASDQLPQSERKVRSREQLGGLLRFYHREAA